MMVGFMRANHESRGSKLKFLDVNETTTTTIPLPRKSEQRKKDLQLKGPHASSAKALSLDYSAAILILAVPLIAQHSLLGSAHVL